MVPRRAHNPKLPVRVRLLLPMAARITDEQRKSVARLTGEGMTIKAIAEQLGISRRSVAGIRGRVRRVKAATPEPVHQASTAAGPVSDDDLAKEMRQGIVDRVRRLETMITAAEVRLTDAISVGTGGDCRSFAIAFGVLLDKQVTLVRAAKELAPVASSRTVRQENTLEPIDAVRQLH